MNNYSYVTVLSNDDYEAGVLGLWNSLRTVQSTYPLLVLISENVSQHIVERLSKITPVKVQKDELELPEDVFKDNTGFFEKWNRTFFKLKAMQLVEFSKIVLLDADMIVRRNIDHLFECPHMSCAFAETLRGGDST